MLVVVALVLALLIKSFAIQAFFIPSASMENTLEINDRVLINKIVYHLRHPPRRHRGVRRQRVVGPRHAPSEHQLLEKSARDFQHLRHQPPGDIYIKRVIGLPGDHVACCNAQGQVTVNGVPLTEGSYLYPGNQPSAQTGSTSSSRPAGCG